MKKYAKIENGKVKAYHTLPKTFENIINFQKASEDIKNEKGFFELITPIVKQYQRLMPLTPNDFDYDKNQFIQKVEDFSQAEIDTIVTSNKKAERNEKLREGVIVQDIWFNEEKLTQFTVMAQMCQATGVIEFEWGKESGWGTVTVVDAFAITLEASNLFSSIYKEYV